MNNELINEQLTLKNGVVIKNRILKSAMSEQIATNHKINQAMIVLYEAWADGGAGVLITGNVMVDSKMLGAAEDIVLENEDDIDMLRLWAQTGRKNGAKIIMQLNHPGRQSPSFLTKFPVAPSAIPIKGEVASFFNPPRELSEDEIYEIINRFAYSAKIAKKAGFDGVQIHAAHGYLISQFLSPLSNIRSDKWGGSIENRMRFLTEIYTKIREATSKEFIVCVKLNSADFQKGGFSEDECIAVSQRLSELGVDFLEISGGTYEKPTMLEGAQESAKESTLKREAYFLDFARKLRKNVDIILAITGGFRSSQAMRDALNSGELDIVGAAKPFCIEPDFANKILNDKDYKISIDEPSFCIKSLQKKLKSVMIMAWYMRHMKNIGSGLKPDLKLGTFSVMFGEIFQNGLRSLRKIRA